MSKLLKPFLQWFNYYPEQGTLSNFLACCDTAISRQSYHGWIGTLSLGTTLTVHYKYSPSYNLLAKHYLTHPPPLTHLSDVPPRSTIMHAITADLVRVDFAASVLKLLCASLAIAITNLLAFHLAMAGAYLQSLILGWAVEGKRVSKEECLLLVWYDGIGGHRLCCPASECVCCMERVA